MLVRTNQFGLKNFYKQLGLSQHFTIRGLIRRTERKYPKAVKSVRFLTVFTITAFLGLCIMPGSNISLQYSLKNLLCRNVQRMSKAWFLYFGNPNPYGYVYSVYRIIYYQFDNDIEDVNSVVDYLGKINKVIDSKDGLKFAIKNQARADNIEMFLQVFIRIVEKYKIDNKVNEYLKDSRFLERANEVLEGSLLGATYPITEKLSRQFSASLKIFEYLLKFEQKGGKRKALQNLLQVLKMEQTNFLAQALKRDEQLKKQLKLTYRQHPELIPIVIEILQTVDQKSKQITNRKSNTNTNINIKND